MEEETKSIKKRLIIKRKSIKNKLNILKHGKMVEEKMFNPITKHLKMIQTKIENNNTTSTIPPVSKVKKEKKIKPKSDTYDIKPSFKLKYKNDDHYDEDDDDYEDADDNFQSKNKLKRKKYNNDDPDKTIYKDFDDDDDDDEDDDDDNYDYGTDDDKKKLKQNVKHTEEYESYLDNLNTLPKNYINGLNEDYENKIFDSKYGIKHKRNSDKLSIGDSDVIVDGNDILIKNKKYKGTIGLYELLFKKIPDNKLFTDEDLRNYQQFVQKTNAHRRYYKANKQIAGSKSYKYKTFIAPLVSSSIGKGMLMEVTGNKIDYVYWDDPNELVEKVQLLLASQSAGHTGHTNEINSIIEELKEARIIK